MDTPMHVVCEQAHAAKPNTEVLNGASPPLPSDDDAVKFKRWTRDMPTGKAVRYIQLVRQL
ncbi:hypothetical protein BP00DRAFT_428215 [Aspergillus indologenus CBS 114.80]|uniref:Uncharacterized protein n=1 Tax=Aspergillus indologenus CBS 114.80 TaxID=1450541 RepID=A0A2V5HVN8_9EURO|nr:hypothetical protein BP00DRAFT_428215 [Aspergillus indologenus CBS 114.80]